MIGVNMINSPPKKGKKAKGEGLKEEKEGKRKKKGRGNSYREGGGQKIGYPD